MAILRRSSFAVPRQWNPTQVPTWPVEVDTTHPLARGLVGFWPLGASIQDVTGLNTTTSSGALTWQASSGGPALNFPNAGHLIVPDAPQLALTGDLTVNAKMLANSYSSYLAPITKTTGNTAAPWDWYFVAGSGQPNFWTNVNGAVFGTSAPPTGVWCDVGFTIIGGTGTHYLNGAPNGSGSTGVRQSDSAVPMLIGSRGDGVTQMNGLMNAASVYSRGLSASEMAWLNAEPFIMLRPVVRRLYFQATAAAPNTTAADFFFGGG